MGISIVRGSTPTITLTNSSQSVPVLGTPLIVIRQDGRKMKFTDIDVSEHSLEFDMTQEQTLSLDAGKNNKTCDLQIFWDKFGKITVSKIKKVPVYGNINNEVIA